MNDLDRQLLNLLQADFPIVVRPFALLAKKLRSSEDAVISQIVKMQQDGIIRRIGAMLDAAKLGYISTLIAAEVAVDKADAFVRSVNVLPGVSHNYARDHRLNVWFTLTVPREELIAETIEQLKRKHNIETIFSLPAKRVYKLRVHFDFGMARPPKTAIKPMPAAGTPEFTDTEKTLIRRLQQNLPLCDEPFAAIAKEVGVDESFVLERIADWKQTGVIRRLGASIYHRRAGYDVNAMMVFDIADKQVDAAGGRLAKYHQISHCYRRKTVDGWPYNLYGMAHCRSQAELESLQRDVSEKIKPIKQLKLISTIEYKKEPVQYFREQL